VFTGRCGSVYPSEGQLLQGADKTEGMRGTEDKAQLSSPLVDFSVDGGPWKIEPKTSAKTS